MSPVLTLVATAVNFHMITGVWNEIVRVRVRSGERMILKCSSSGTEKTWLGPDFNNLADGKELIYFSNYTKHPKLNLSKYVVHEKNYGLTICNFQKKDTGFYRCRFLNNGTFYETRYYVSLSDDVIETSSIGYEGRKDSENAPGIHINVKETSSQFITSPGHSKPNWTLTITLIVVFLLGILLTIIGIFARRKWGTLGERMNSFVASFRKDAERITLADDIREQPGLIDEPVEPTDGLNYVEVLTEPLSSRQTRIRGIENRIMYSEIDHSLKA